MHHEVQINDYWIAFDANPFFHDIAYRKRW